MAFEGFVEHDSDPARVFHGSFGFHEVGQHVMPGTDGEPSGIRASMLIKEMCSYAWVRERYGDELPNDPWLTHPRPPAPAPHRATGRSEEHTPELQSLIRSSSAVFCLKKTTPQNTKHI